MTSETNREANSETTRTAADADNNAANAAARNAVPDGAIGVAGSASDNAANNNAVQRAAREAIPSKRNPEGTRRRILKAATEEFRLGGLAGARVDCIARRAETNERMLYYYFGSKEKLFIAALEATYEAFIVAQTTLELAHLPADQALIVYAKNIWEYLRDKPELVRLVNNENLHQATHLKRSSVRESFHPVVEQLAQILRRGAVAGVFRDDIEPLRLYLSISALGFYVISNRYTLQQTFACDFADDIEHPRVVQQHVDMLLAYVRPSVGT